MKRGLSVAFASALTIGGCASPNLDSGREWQRAECNRIIDNESRVRCLKRVDEDYGRRKDEAAADRNKR